MSNKILTSVLVFCFVIGTIHAASLILGSVGRNDTLIVYQLRERKPVKNQLVQENFQYKGHKNITYIAAIDNFKNNTGGFVHVVSGGLGRQNVTLRLSSSAANRGFNYTISIYGR